MIIFKIGTLFSPLKLFVPISAAFFLTGLGYYLYTYMAFNRFTNMSATLLITAGGGTEAVKLAEQVVAARSDDPTALDTLGRACDATRDNDCARRAYGKLVKLPAGREVSTEALNHAHLRMKQLKSHRR